MLVNVAQQEAGDILKCQEQKPYSNFNSSCSEQQTNATKLSIRIHREVENEARADLGTPALCNDVNSNRCKHTAHTAEQSSLQASSSSSSSSSS